MPTLELAPIIETSSSEILACPARIAPRVTVLHLADVVEEVREGELAFVPLQGGAVRQTVALVHQAEALSIRSPTPSRST